MFDKSNRYITKGIQEEIPVELQIFLWNRIEMLKKLVQELEYLQVFVLTSERADDILIQIVEHRQEVPEYNKIHKILCKEMVDAKIFVIDDENGHATMMLAEEY